MLHLAAHLPWPEVEALARAGAVALLPVGSTEAHGPHLPLNVDVVIAEAVCQRAAGLLEERQAVQFPAVAYALTDFAAPFSGTVSLPAATAEGLLRGVLTGVLAGGFSQVCVVNHHLEPAHFSLVHAAARAVRAVHGPHAVVVPDHRRPPVGPSLGDEFMHGGSHAGWYETSLMLAAAPGLVREDVRAALPDNPVNLPGVIKGGARDFLEAGGPRAYFGAPASATAAEGHRLLDLLARLTVQAIREAPPPSPGLPVSRGGSV